MIQFTEEQLEEIKMIFKGIYECDQKIEELKEETKVFSSSKKDYIKNLAEKMDVTPKILSKAYKDYMDAINNPQLEVMKTDIISMFLTFYNPEDLKD